MVPIFSRNCVQLRQRVRARCFLGRATGHRRRLCDTDGTKTSGSARWSGSRTVTFKQAEEESQLAGTQCFRCTDPVRRKGRTRAGALDSDTCRAAYRPGGTGRRRTIRLLLRHDTTRAAYCTQSCAWSGLYRLWCRNRAACSADTCSAIRNSSRGRCCGAVALVDRTQATTNHRRIQSTPRSRQFRDWRHRKGRHDFGV